ncbi:translesion error-prone DNA polymerase V autoproteolytic subunit [Methylobacterium sp. C25]|uniref:LexA family protein n=1 Tax=Methylobacterium sp. C25 TaxID=2721622 RepID=UPI001F44778F|nr:translesion error-prone DNA polymerase V autoproteolytic subunit [Methylobacterium sp. C25]MCE4226345.1 translesion error-prone DNA polymerase V autoproteolytic subunit [Methylobacterium sp. C25]
MPTINRRGGPRPNAGRPRGERTTVVRLPVDIALAARRAAEARGGNMSGIGAFLSGEARLIASAPLVTASVACGFPSPAEDSLDRPLDLNELHGIGLSSVFLVRVHGDSMIGVGLHHGDIAVVNKAVEARHGRIVVACLNGDFTLKTYQVRDDRIVLHPENPAFPDIEVPAEADFQVWGVVTGSSRVF